MDKKLIYIGIGLLVLAVVLIFAAPSIAFQFNTSTQNATLAPNQILTIPLNASKPSVFLIIYQASSGISFYFLNATAYNNINAYGGLYQSAAAYEGRGTLEIVRNSSAGTFPGAFSNASVGYFYKNSTILNPGKYYLIFQSHNHNSTSLEYQINVNNSLSSNLLPIALLGIVFMIALVGGIIAVAYGLFKNAAQEKNASSDAKIQEAYAQIEKGSKSAKHPAHTNRSSKKKKGSAN